MCLSEVIWFLSMNLLPVKISEAVKIIQKLMKAQSRAFDGDGDSSLSESRL
jgi:hypothetical protein